jgi:V-type H+-transporting ATPase subunit C
MSGYQAAKQMLAAANRKATGSLAVRDLRGLVKRADVVDTENLTTLIVAVPRYHLKDFQASYEKWCDMVVPRSAKVVAEDSEHSLQRVVLFRRVVDDFKQAARTRGCQVRICQLSCCIFCARGSFFLKFSFHGCFLWLPTNGVMHEAS